jgi:hypothetical protein
VNVRTRFVYPGLSGVLSKFLGKSGMNPENTEELAALLLRQT